MKAPDLTLEQYASLCVDIELAPPAETAAVLRRYHLTPEMRQALDAEWSRALGAQPAKRAAFEHARATYRAWVARGRR